MSLENIAITIKQQRKSGENGLRCCSRAVRKAVERKFVKKKMTVSREDLSVFEGVINVCPVILVSGLLH